MRLGIDFHVYDGKFQGSRSYLISIYKEAIKLSPQTTFVFFVGDPAKLIREIAEFSSPNVEVVAMKRGSSLWRLAVTLPYLCFRYRIDVLHTQYIIPPWLTCKSIVTIHDILFESNPEFFEKSFVLRSRLLVRLSASRASRILTVSDFSKSELILRYNIDGNNIGITKNAVDINKYSTQSDNDAHTLEKYGLVRDNYILTVGRIEPRKNHVGLIRAYLSSKYNIPIIIVGQPDFSYTKIQKEINRSSAIKKVSVLSDVEDSELPALYRNCFLFAYTSFAEGFGMPPLEAMAAGAPVLCSNTTALPEVVGNSAVLVNPYSISDIQLGLDRFLDQASLRKILSQRGKEISLNNKWVDSAHALLNEIKKC